MDSMIRTYPSDPYSLAVISRVLEWFDHLEWNDDDSLLEFYASDVVYARLYDYHGLVEIISITEDGFAYRTFVYQNGIGTVEKYMVNPLNENNGEWMLYERNR